MNPGPSRILKTMAVLVPRLRITPVTAPSKPARMEPTPMMVPVPMMTPSTVRNERTLFSRSVASARPITEIEQLHGLRSLRPQSDDRIQPRGSPRRINSEEQSDGGGQRHAEHHRIQRDIHGHGREVAHGDGDQPGDGHAR